MNMLDYDSLTEREILNELLNPDINPTQEHNLRSLLRTRYGDHGKAVNKHIEQATAIRDQRRIVSRGGKTLHNAEVIAFLALLISLFTSFIGLFSPGILFVSLPILGISWIVWAILAVGSAILNMMSAQACPEPTPYPLPPLPAPTGIAGQPAVALAKAGLQAGANKAVPDTPQPEPHEPPKNSRIEGGFDF